MSEAPVNALSRASSAYLRSAMHQPIRWHEWGEEAFATARRENKPILLDIGAVWCHWCHVMDRESYDNPKIAQLVNERFVAVKVDRDERPDIDSRYQVAVSSISGQGGWPLTAFLTPDGKPFYGGTYFPPDDHYGRPGFKRVLLSIADAYREKNDDVVEQAKLVETALARAESFSGADGEFSPKVIEEIAQSAVKMFDPANGGFGHAPKFPHPAALDLLIERCAHSGDEQLRHVFVLTLEKMARGGMYDQLAGGFHRYSVDEHWGVPHFEKMSYDNSELLKNYLHAYQVTGDEFFGRIAKDIIRWVQEWLSDPEHGGFYASQDADFSMDDDGDYFTWTLAEVQSALTAEEFSVARLYYGIAEIGQMHHNHEKNVLHVASTVGEIAQRLGFPTARAQELLDSAKKKMYAARLKRPTPYVDKTVYAGWNAMCISAFLEAGKVMDLDAARHFGLRSLDRILSEGWNAKRGLKHVIAYSDGDAAGDVPGMLDDYAFTTIACLDAYEATADLSYFKFARQIGDAMVDRFFDPVAGGFFDAEKTEAKSLGVLGSPRKPFQDSPTPAGNPVAAIALLRLHGYTEERSYREKAEQTMEVLAGVAGKYGIFAATYGIAAVHLSQPATQVVVLGSGAAADELYRAAVSQFSFGKAVLRLDRSQAVAGNLPPALANTIPHLPAGENAAAVVCSGFACQPPVHSPAELSRILAELGTAKTQSAPARAAQRDTA
ncbi:MAG: thioredoxin domain-containing protein [Acidobacteriales bacterium]|nr:thioredoxin domain-containing protein [Terriglobales bacterium]